MSPSSHGPRWFDIYFDINELYRRSITKTISQSELLVLIENLFENLGCASGFLLSLSPDEFFEACYQELSTEFMMLKVLKTIKTDLSGNS